MQLSSQKSQHSKLPQSTQVFQKLEIEFQRTV